MSARTGYSFGLQAMVDAISRASHDGETLTLGELSDQLSAAPPDVPVEFHGAGLDGQSPCNLDSWRGIYADLALEHYATTAPVTVGQLLGRCFEANGRTYEGYKGGDYRMDVDTPVWVDNWGEWTPDRGLKAIRPLLRDGEIVKVRLIVESWAEEDDQ